MNKILVSIICFFFILSSCSDINKKKVKYVVTGAISAYNLQYLDETNELVKIEVESQSAQESWTHSYIAEKGDIVYISGNYKDINSSLKIMILIDGSIYKQASNTADTLSYLTVSGTIPY